MKKMMILFLGVLMSFSMAVYCFALDSNDVLTATSYDVILLENGNLAVKHWNQIYMEGQIYEKENCVMIPLKMAVNIENQNYDEKREAVYKKEGTQAKFTLDEREIVFFEGKRDVMIDGHKKRLYAVPDIKEDDVFVSAEDFYILLDLNSRGQAGRFPWEKGEGSKQAGWFFRGDDGAHIREIKEEEKEEYRFSTEYEGTLFEGKREKNMPAYESNGHFMIGWKGVSYFAEPKSAVEHKILLESVWEKETNTLYVKTWDGFAKDAVFQKDSNIMILDGVPVKMEAKAEIKNDRLFIPITAVFQMLNIPEEDITWIEKGKNVSVLY